MSAELAGIEGPDVVDDPLGDPDACPGSDEDGEFKYDDGVPAGTAA